MKPEEIFEELIQTIERNAIDNQANIIDVKFWAKSWRDEMQLHKEIESEKNQNETKNDLLSCFLFLDDMRDPEHSFEYTREEMFIKQKWEVVRNFDEFKKYIETNGMPVFISFDHDLAETHYTPEHLWDDYDKSKEWQDKQVHTEKTGYECAMWLVDFCIDNNLQLPNYYCHSKNPVGKDKIIGLLSSFKKSK